MKSEGVPDDEVLRALQKVHVTIHRHTTRRHQTTCGTVSSGMDWIERYGTHDVSLLLHPLRQSFVGPVAVHKLASWIQVKVAFTFGCDPDWRIDESSALSTQAFGVKDWSVIIFGFDVETGRLPKGVCGFRVDLRHQTTRQRSWFQLSS